MLLLTGYMAATAQNRVNTDSLAYPARYVSQHLPIITDKELMKFESLPELTWENFPGKSAKAPLPYKIDNTTQPYMIATTWQGGYECGQSASIAYNFTFEMDRARNVPASDPANQYVTHFAWNFLNNGYNYTGVSYYDSWEILRMCGTPNVSDYGGNLWTGGEKRWMTGYNLYYNAMQNRLYSGYNINVGTPDGLLLLKNWLANHLDNAVVGGLANFYAQYGNPNTTLPAGTEEGGKALMSTWGGSPSHTWTIVGYNDSIRFDFNSDGQFTNHLDINGDGVVDMHDWEIGGLKFANGYAGPGWGNGGYAYMMYKCLADDIGNGGIWNHRVSVMYIKASYQPLLTMKIVLKHNCRNRIKVNAGLSTNLSDTRPEFVLDFPIFNYQGGTYYMQGDSTEAGKTIEFGLDISPLLKYISPGQNAKYFLQVIENDPTSTSTGQIISYAIIDYAAGGVQSDCPSVNVNLNNNDTTRLSIARAVNFSKVNIITNALPEAEINQAYNFQLAAGNGVGPYHWDFIFDFAESYSSSATFPAVTSHQLTTNSTGFAVQNIGFDFPFYGHKFNKFYISPDGYLKFTDQPYTWPYLIDKTLLFRSTCMIAPFLTDLVLNSGDYMWYEGNAQYAIFRWKAHVNGQSGSSVNVAVKLFPNGTIEFYYDNLSVATTTSWMSAVSAGDNSNYQSTSLSGKIFTNSTTKKVTLTPPVLPDGLSLSDEGLLSGTITTEFNAVPLGIRVTDNNMISNTKILNFSTYGFLAHWKTHAGSDSIINAGEHVVLSLGLKNSGSQALASAQLLLSTSDPIVSFTDATESGGTLNADDSVIFLNAFEMDIDTNVTDNHLIDFNLCVFNSTDTFNIPLTLPVRSLILDIGNTGFNDGNNNIPEPGENGSLLVEIKNIGGATAQQVKALLSTNDPFVDVMSDSMYVSSLPGNSASNAFFVIHIGQAAPDGHIVVFNVKLSAGGGYVTHKFFAMQIGGNAEDFETGDLTLFPWSPSGDSVWFVTTVNPFEGLYCAKSGDIDDYEQSDLSVGLNILNGGSVSFYRKVSCEAHPGVTDYDFLAFFIDGVEMARWDGVTAWERFEYPVTAGQHTFRWMYKKDYSVSSGEDCAWIDYIVFPPSVELSSNVLTNPQTLYKSLRFDSIAIDSVVIGNLSSSTLIYQSTAGNFSANGNSGWLMPEVQYGSLDPNSTGSLKLLFSSWGLGQDTYNCNLHLTFNFTDTVNIPVTFNVFVPTGLEENSAGLPGLQVLPNPFVENGYVKLRLVKDSQVKLFVMDVHGRIVRNLWDGKLSPGTHEFVWDATDQRGAEVVPGIYFVKMVCGETVQVERLIYSR